MTTEELKSKIDTLRMDRIVLSTQLVLETEGYYTNRPVNSKVVEELRTKIVEIDTELQPLIMEYEKGFHHYYVRFSSQIPNTYGSQPETYFFHDIMRSKIDCKIDSTKERIVISERPDVLELIQDFGKQLVNRYTNFQFSVIVKRD